MVRVGQIVNFVLDAASLQPGEIRPAIVVRVWSETTVNLQVFVDGVNDYAPLSEMSQSNLYTTSIVWRTSVRYDPDFAAGTWHTWEELK